MIATIAACAMTASATVSGHTQVLTVLIYCVQDAYTEPATMEPVPAQATSGVVLLVICRHAARRISAAVKASASMGPAIASMASSVLIVALLAAIPLTVTSTANALSG